MRHSEHEYAFFFIVNFVRKHCLVGLLSKLCLTLKHIPVFIVTVIVTDILDKHKYITFLIEWIVIATSGILVQRLKIGVEN